MEPTGGIGAGRDAGGIVELARLDPRGGIQQVLPLDGTGDRTPGYPNRIWITTKTPCRYGSQQGVF